MPSVIQTVRRQLPPKTSHTALFDRLREIATQRKLDLHRPADRGRAEALLFDEMGSTVQTARTFDECLRAVERREGGRLCFAERPTDLVHASRILAKERPDLVPIYGSRDKPGRRKPGDEGTDERAAELERRVNDVCDRRGLLRGVDGRKIDEITRAVGREIMGTKTR